MHDVPPVLQRPLHAYLILTGRLLVEHLCLLDEYLRQAWSKNLLRLLQKAYRSQACDNGLFDDVRDRRHCMAKRVCQVEAIDRFVAPDTLTSGADKSKCLCNKT